MEGTCLCEGVKFSTEGEPERVFIWYCTHCIKNVGGPGQVIAKFKTEQVSLKQGHELLKDYTLTDTKSGFPKKKVFCETCGCTLWTIPTHHGDNLRMVRTSILTRGLDVLLPVAEMFGDKRPRPLQDAVVKINSTKG